MAEDTRLKKCRECGLLKPLAAYPSVTPRRRVWICRECNHEKYVRHYAETRAYIDRVKLERGCADCGYNAHPAALEFDHLPGFVKKMKVSAMVGTYNLDRIKEEIAKCDVVCANCHAIRTITRANTIEVWQKYREELAQPGLADPQQFLWEGE